MPLPHDRRHDDMPHAGLSQERYERILQAMAYGLQRLPALLEDLHPADTANLLERLPRNRRALVLQAMPEEHLADVLAELEEGVKEHVVQLLKPEAVKQVIQELESDDAADLAQVVEEISDEEGPDAEDLLDDHQHKHLLDFEPDTAGSLMQIEVLRALPTRTVGEVVDYLRADHEDEIPYNPGTVFVVTQSRKVLGSVSFHRLIRSPLTAKLGDVMRANPLVVLPETPIAEVVQLFEKYDMHNLAVVNKRKQLLGRITIDDVLDAVMEENVRQQSRSVGLDEDEDLFCPPTETMRQRLPWLVVNLGTAIMAAAVIALFEASIAKLTTLAVLMPIVASMGGNATTQTQTVIIRGLALGQITPQNAWVLFRKEFLSGSYVGTVLALMMALGTWLIYGNGKLAMVIALATLANHLIAAFAGWMTPLVLKRLKYDPAIAASVITTTFTDVGGFFVFLGLATVILM